MRASPAFGSTKACGPRTLGGLFGTFFQSLMRSVLCPSICSLLPYPLYRNPCAAVISPPLLATVISHFSDNEMHAAFSTTTYSKGAAVARTWSLALGGSSLDPVRSNSSFLRGTAAYLAKFAFGIASTRDLVDCLCEAAGSEYTSPTFSSVADCRGDLMRWASLAGVPLLSVAPHPNSASPVGVVTRFTSNGQGQGLWQLPLQGSGGAVVWVGGGTVTALPSMAPVFDPSSAAPLISANSGCSG